MVNCSSNIGRERFVISAHAATFSTSYLLILLKRKCDSQFEHTAPCRNYCRFRKGLTCIYHHSCFSLCTIVCQIHQRESDARPMDRDHCFEACPCLVQMTERKVANTIVVDRKGNCSEALHCV